VDITGITNSPVSSPTGTAETKLVGDFETFLLLLTAQLQNQDPLSPMDTTEFTNQLVGFSGVEQQITQNKNLESLINLQKINQTTQALSFLGTRIEASGDITTLEGGLAEWNFELTENMRSVAVEIFDEGGDTVFQTNAAVDDSVGTNAGIQKFVWDGRDASGQTLPDGEYRISIEAANLTDKSITVGTTVVGTVTGLQTVDDSMVLFIGSLAVPLKDVLSVQAGGVLNSTGTDTEQDAPPA